MSRAGLGSAVALLLLAAAGASVADEAVVLKGGAVIQLKSPPVRRGDQVLLTRADGTLLSVPAVEIDAAATRAQKASAAPAAAAPAAPAMTPAEAAKAARGGPKARVRITDADVNHEIEPPPAPGEGQKSEAVAGSGAGRVEVIEYSQSRSAGTLTVTGTLRNPGTVAATNVRLTINAVDAKGTVLASSQASVSNGLLEPGRTASFSANLSIPEGGVATIRFVPQWITTTPAEEETPETPAAGAPGASPAAGAPPAAAAGQPASAPAPAPTPRFQGVLYAAPPPSASSSPPPDGKTGYIPGAASPENQPKPPQ